MQHHHIDPIDVRPPPYTPKQQADHQPQSPPHRLRQFLLPTTLLASIISVAYLTLSAI